MDLEPYDSCDLEHFLVGGVIWKNWMDIFDGIGVSFHDPAWLASTDLERLKAMGGAVKVMKESQVFATYGESSEFDERASFECGEESFLIKYVWDLLRVNEQVVGNFKSSEIKGEVHANAVIDGFVKIGEGTKLLPGVYIEGNVTIGERCKIGPNCYIRGNTTIGDQCHIGQSVEIKNCMIGNKSNVGHLSYIGDSILGHGVNLGSGTTTSNFRHDGKNHRSAIQGELIDTGRRKFGAIIADGVHTGINTSIYPGRKLRKNVTTLPGEIVKLDK